MAAPKTPLERGSLQIWFSAGAVTLMLFMTLTLLGVILVKGLSYFWVKDVSAYVVNEDLGFQTNLVYALGEFAGAGTQERMDASNRVIGTWAETRIKRGNRDLYGANQDFRFIRDDFIVEQTQPDDVYVLERMEFGNFYGYFERLEGTDETDLAAAIEAARKEHEPYEELREKAKKLNFKKGKLDIKLTKARFYGKPTEELEKQIAENQEESESIRDKYAVIDDSVREKVAVFKGYANASFPLNGDAPTEDAIWEESTMALVDILRFYQPNQMSFAAKSKLYAAKVWEVVSTNPREANTEGGVFPAIYGTVLMVMLMSIIVMPFGVIAAIYLREYAKEGFVVRCVRIGVNNLAGVPSIVYGIFGLGFFAYTCGGFIDSVFYPWAEHGVFKGPSILWASMTLAVLTVPVVIVATEEALASIPRGVREGSFALGATKFQTVMGVLLPMASPGILTGFILSTARAAGEVAPLMLTGAIEHTDSQPFIDSHAPHINQQFLHLGFNIYHYGFKSPNVEATRPMVYVTTLLLLALVISMNIIAIVVRNRMRKKFTPGAF